MKIRNQVVASSMAVIVGIPVLAFTFPYAWVHFWNVVRPPPPPPKVQQALVHDKAWKAEMMKGDDNELGMKYILAMLHNHRVARGKAHNPTADFIGYHNYAIPGESPIYPYYWRINRDPSVVVDGQGRAGPLMSRRIVDAEKLLEEYAEKKSALFEDPAHPGLKCVIRLYPINDWLQPPGSPLGRMLAELQLVHESPSGAKYFCKKDSIKKPPR
jgi:hypothetical protein